VGARCSMLVKWDARDTPDWVVFYEGLLYSAASTDRDRKHLNQASSLMNLGQSSLCLKNGLFPGRNLDTSQPSYSRDLTPPLLRLAHARLSFGSCLLRSAYPSYYNTLYVVEPILASCAPATAQQWRLARPFNSSERLVFLSSA
jgi:hypothetical protein